MICFFFLHILSFILFHFHSFALILNLILYFFKKTLSILIFYSLNSALCLHLAINSHLRFNNFQGLDNLLSVSFHLNTDYIYYRNILEYLTFLIRTIEYQGLNLYFFKRQKCLDRAVWCFRCSWEKEYL